jgi:Spy/CpxP family protein refolding chaperone
MVRLRIREVAFALALGAMLALSQQVSAQMDMGGGGMTGGGHMPGMMGGQCPNCPAPERPKWMSSMTDDQKAKMDAMHLKLGKEMGLLEARLDVKEAELKNLVTQDSPDKKAVSKKIDEIMDLKKEMMTRRYDHVMELRGILTSEQRMSFDMMFFGGMRHMMGGKGMTHGGMEHGMGGMGQGDCCER